MALKNGYSKATVDSNIADMERAGYPRAQAVRVSLDSARNAYFRRYPNGALPAWLAPKDGRRMRNPAGCAPLGAARKRNPVPPSARAGNVSRAAQIAAAEDLYTRFTGHDTTEKVSIDKPVIPDAVLVVGDVDGILYTTVRDGQTEKYIHKFKKNSRPLFCVSHDGKQIFLLGGAYDFTERGIVDRT